MSEPADTTVPENSDERIAVLFDIDGTLVDSNYLHVDAWDRAFADTGRPVDAWRIHRSIGKDGGELLESLLDGSDEVEQYGERAKELHSEYYLQNTSRLRVIGGARELLGELAGRGIAVVLATSAPENELEILRELLDVDDAIFAATSSGDVETAKPEPDIVEVALDRAGVPASRAVMVGDAVWDIEAAARAGVECIGVRSGGFGEQELRDAGAVAVYGDVAELLANLDDSPIGNLAG